jgi:ATP-dependent DNA helicase RecQ
MENGHDGLKSYGSLSDYGQSAVRQWIEQLVAQEFLHKSGDFNILKVTPRGLQAKEESVTPLLTEPFSKRRERKKAKSLLPASRKPARAVSLDDEAVLPDPREGMDEELFEALRALRLQIARRKRVPAYVVFSDAALVDMAQRKPSNRDEFLLVKGVGQKKCRMYAKQFLGIINP